ncbi:N-acetylmuramoyl-L-alanine amidase [Streptomyces albus subsp. chlorinus]|uniref:peptidoglycan recognition protein family protein n=1 Tax=Streptomyces albus TaxID=1888 RepID=UPI0031F6546D
MCALAAGTGDDDVLRAVIAERSPLRPNENNTDGNRAFYEFECVNRGDGKDTRPFVQRDAMVRASAALLRAHGWRRGGSASVIGHLEWTNQKIDPRPARGNADVRMSTIRRLVADRLDHAPSWFPKK